MVRTTTVMIIGARFVSLNATGGSGIVLVATSAGTEFRFRAKLVRQGYTLLNSNNIMANEQLRSKKHEEREATLARGGERERTNT